MTVQCAAESILDALVGFTKKTAVWFVLARFTVQTTRGSGSSASRANLYPILHCSLTAPSWT